MARVLGRSLWATLVFVLSAIVAIAVLITLGTEHIVRDIHARSTATPDDLGIWLGYLEQLSGMWGLVSVLTLTPPILAVVVGEVARLRSFFYWVPAGGLALVAGPALARLSDRPLEVPIGASGQLVLWLATAGFAGGLFYWLLAGRLIKDGDERL